jgi:hypothetical protein
MPASTIKSQWRAGLPEVCLDDFFESFCIYVNYTKKPLSGVVFFSGTLPRVEMTDFMV